MTFQRYAHIALRTGLGFAAAAATTLVLLGQAGRYRHSLDQLNALLPVLLVALALLLAFALRMRDRGTTVVPAIGLVIGGVQLGSAALTAHGAPTAPRAEPAIKIVTLSAYHSNPDPAGIRKVIAAEAPDMLLLQEANGAAANVIDTLLPGYYRVGSCKKAHCTLMLLSRWPMRHVKVSYLKSEARPDLMLVEVAAPFGRFRVMNLHLPRPYDNHAIEFTRILARTARENAAVPLIMAGDFNTVTGSFGLARLGANSGLLRRDGFTPTYPADEIFPAFAGIDHIFASNHWAGADCHRTAAGNSDHYGVACRLPLIRKD